MATGPTEREREVREQRATLWAQMSPLVTKLNAGERLTVEDEKRYDDLDAELQPLDKELRRIVSARDLAAEEAAGADLDTRGARSSEEIDRERREADAWERYLRHGAEGLRSDDRGLLTPQHRGEPVNGLETRVGPAGDAAPLQTSPGSQGGYLIPQGFWHNLQIALKQFGGVYPLFRQVDTETGNQMPWPTTDPTSLVAQLLTENTQVTPQDLSFGQGMLNAFTYVAGPFLASIQVEHDSAFNVQSFVTDRIGEAIGRSQAAVAWGGTGSSQPLGLTAAITAKGAGSVGAGGWYATTAAKQAFRVGSNTATTELALGALSFDTVLDVITYVDPAYRKAGNCAWVMNDTDMQRQRKVSDAFGHPLWQPNVQVGGTAADNLYGYPVHIDNNAPVIAASTLSGPVFGSLDHAMVARNVRQVGTMRLVERYADFLAIAYLGYMRYDIRSNDMRAVTQVKFAAT